MTGHRWAIAIAFLELGWPKTARRLAKNVNWMATLQRCLGFSASELSNLICFALRMLRRVVIIRLGQVYDDQFFLTIFLKSFI